MKKLKVTLDTNVIISGIILEHGTPYSILELWRRGTFTLITSNELTGEVVDVLGRIKIIKNYHIPVNKLTIISKLLQQKSQVVNPDLYTETIPLRDKKDAFIIKTALIGQADYLVTGDKDLLSLSGLSIIKPLVILTPQQFLELLRD